MRSLLGRPCWRASQCSAKLSMPNRLSPRSRRCSTTASVRCTSSARGSRASSSASETTTMPSRSPMTTSPGATVTPPQTTACWVVPRRSAVPAAGQTHRAYTGSERVASLTVSRQAPSMTMPASLRRVASVANSSPPSARVPPPPSMTSTSRGSDSCSALMTVRKSSRQRTVRARPTICRKEVTGRRPGSMTRMFLSASQSAAASSAATRSRRSEASMRFLRAEKASESCSMSLALPGVLGLSPPGPTPDRPPRSPAKGRVERQVHDVGRPLRAEPCRKGTGRRAQRGRVAALVRDRGETLQPREQLLPEPRDPPLVVALQRRRQPPDDVEDMPPRCGLRQRPPVEDVVPRRRAPGGERLAVRLLHGAHDARRDARGGAPGQPPREAFEQRVPEAAAVEVEQAQPAPPAGAAARLVQVALAEGQERAGLLFHPPRDQVDLLVGQGGRAQPQGPQAASVLPDGLQPFLLGECTAPRVGPGVLEERLGRPGRAEGPADAGVVVGTPGGRPV